ncbi:uncharacterized protein [Arachis hypogaea]|uniref:uncharacterized protein n=1 Tax=Arachis hypogaea TaxID=3818 RepID=UPI003B219531
MPLLRKLSLDVCDATEDNFDIPDEPTCGSMWMAATMHAKINRRKLDKLNIIKICQPELSVVYPLRYLSKNVDNPTLKSLYVNGSCGLFGIGSAVCNTLPHRTLRLSRENKGGVILRGALKNR